MSSEARGYLGNFHEVSDDSSSLLGGGFTEHHQLDPLRDAVEKRYEPLQDGIIHRTAVPHKTMVILKLDTKQTRPALEINQNYSISRLLATFCSQMTEFFKSALDRRNSFFSLIMIVKLNRVYLLFFYYD